MAIDEIELANEIGKVIARRRQAAKLTQEEVAEKLGVGNEAVSRLERGVVVPTIIRLVELASIFNCAASDFLSEASSLPADQSRELLRMLEGLKPQDRMMLVELVQKLSSRLKECR